MSVIAAASVGIKTMADGTLRITCDIEPVNAQAAFLLFGSPGTPMALAALKVGHAAKSGESASEQSAQQQSGTERDKPKGGALAKLAGMWCADFMFRQWVGHETNRTDITEEDAADFVRARCGVKSRAALDSNEHAARRFQQLIREPFMAWARYQGVAA